LRRHPSSRSSLQTEKPLFLVLYGDSKRVIVQTGSEPPGERELSS
jgi:hypothetical protein